MTERTIVEPAREIPIVAQVDVLVAGAGPAGIAAALASARQGARTLLVERYGYVGGMVTGAHVVYMLGMGDGKQVMARGILKEIRDRLEPLGAITDLPDGIDYAVDAEVFKWQAIEWLQEAGVEMLFNAAVCAPIMEGTRVAGVFIESKSGRQAIMAGVTIDCTADADLAYRAGCPCDNETHDVTLVMRVSGVDEERLAEFVKDSPGAYQTITETARQLNGGTPFGSPRYLKGVDVTDAKALTDAENRLRVEAFRTVQYLKAHCPGYEKAEISRTWPQFGMRLSRRIHGAYWLTDDDLRANKRFDDSIAQLGVYFPDWGPTYAQEGLAYDVPYGCLVPQEVEGLLVAGRCISADAIAGNTMRLLVPCFATGQAAGSAAAIASELDCAPRSVPTGLLRQSLEQQDVYLG